MTIQAHKARIMLWLVVLTLAAIVWTTQHASAAGRGYDSQEEAAVVENLWPSEKLKFKEMKLLPDQSTFVEERLSNPDNENLASYCSESMCSAACLTKCTTDNN